MFLGYNYRIMVINIRPSSFSGPWDVSWHYLGNTFVASKQQTATEKYKRHRQEHCAGVPRPFTPEQEKACEEESNSPSDYLPWGVQTRSVA